MKALHKMNYPERAKLLHQLFPEYIPGLLDFIEGMAYTIPEEEDHNRAKHHMKAITFEEWLALAAHISAVIARYGGRLHTSSRLFSNQLFSGKNAAFCIYCLKVYCMTRKPVYAKFNSAIHILFI